MHKKVLFCIHVAAVLQILISLSFQCTSFPFRSIFLASNFLGASGAMDEEEDIPSEVAFPSEQLWSIASRIVTIRRAKLSSEIVANIMLLKENGWILEKHYSSITGKEGILPTMYGSTILKAAPEEDDI
jgi:hypothetical protein